jgi:hypothetical protein
VGAVLKLARPFGGEPHERFVDERRRLQGLPRALAAHVAGGDAAQLVIDERHQVGIQARLVYSFRSILTD